MMQTAQARIELIQRQLQELDVILIQAQKDLNTVAGGERVKKWKAKAIPLFSSEFGPNVAQRLASTTPGPSFTSDLLEELSDEIEVYRSFLFTLMEEVKKAPAGDR
jgi:hypothetical protein